MSEKSQPSDNIDKKILSEIGHRLAILRKSLRLDQEQMAKTIGIPPSTYRSYEQGRGRLSIDLLIWLADHQFSLNWLLVGQGEMIPATSPEALELARNHLKTFGSMNTDLLKFVIETLFEAIAPATPTLPPPARVTGILFSVMQMLDDRVIEYDREKLASVIAALMK